MRTHQKKTRWKQRVFVVSGLDRRALHAACDVFPVYQIVEEVGQIGRTLVAEVDVIGVLPYIAAQESCLTKA